MHQVHVLLSRADAERLSDLLSSMDPSPVSAVSIEEASRTQWSLDAFSIEEHQAREAAAIVEREIPDARVSVQKLEDKDWVAMSLAGLPAVEAGPFLVAGVHELVRVHGGRKRVWIEAGPAFGTGHHGTTKGCLLAIAKLARKGPLGKVLDVGTGSAVLSIAALKAGAVSALGTDLDGESIRIAKENRRNNHCGPALKLLHAAGANHDFIRRGAPYDMVLANILAKPLVTLSGDLVKLVKPGGHIILSGLLTHQEPQVRAAYANRGMTLIDRGRLNGWSTLVWRRPK
jgi:ribosomal protein L11 methyltransferase